MTELMETVQVQLVECRKIPKIDEFVILLFGKKIWN